MLKALIQRLLLFFYPIFQKILPFQVYAYLSVGAANTLFNIALFSGCYRLISTSSSFFVLGVDLTLLAVEIATCISFLVSVVTGFWLSKNFAFTSADNGKKEHTELFLKYFLVALQGQFTDYLLTKGLIVLLHIDATVTYLLSTVIILTLTYFLQKYYTFRSKMLGS